MYIALTFSTNFKGLSAKYIATIEVLEKLFNSDILFPFYFIIYI